MFATNIIKMSPTSQNCPSQSTSLRIHKPSFQFTVISLDLHVELAELWKGCPQHNSSDYKVYITMWHKNRVKPHITAVFSADRVIVMKRLHFRKRFRRENMKFFLVIFHIWVFNLFWFETKFSFSGNLNLSGCHPMLCDDIFSLLLGKWIIIKFILLMRVDHMFV